MAGRQLISRPSRRGFNIILRKPDPGHAPLGGVGRLVVITTAKGAANLVFIAPKPRLKFSVGNGRPKCFPAVDGVANPPLGVHIRRELCERASGGSDQPTASGASRARLEARIRRLNKRSALAVVLRSDLMIELSGSLI